MQARCFRCDDPGTVRFERSPYALRVCSQCGMQFVSPQPSDEERIAVYDDEGYFEKLEPESMIAGFLRNRWESSRLALAAPWKRRSSTLLEIGCARGSFLELAQSKGWEVTGVEISPGAAKQAAVRTDRPVHAGPLETAGFADAMFDVVAGWDVLEHVPNPSAFLTEVHRILKPNGGLILSCPNVDTWPPRLFRGKWWTLKPNEHLWHFSPRTLRQALLDAGFSPKQCITSPLRNENLGRFDSMTALATKPVVA
jgi:2-polyprenyl-3-methyl-5-hydroxy-6-metoxy-1,4-benzoquinol methylase